MWGLNDSPRKPEHPWPCVEADVWDRAAGAVLGNRHLFLLQHVSSASTKTVNGNLSASPPTVSWSCLSHHSLTAHKLSDRSWASYLISQLLSLLICSNGTYLIALLGGWYEVTQTKASEQCLLHNKCSINVSCFYYVTSEMQLCVPGKRERRENEYMAWAIPPGREPSCEQEAGGMERIPHIWVRAESKITVCKPMQWLPHTATFYVQSVFITANDYIQKTANTFLYERLKEFFRVLKNLFIFIIFSSH